MANNLSTTLKITGDISFTPEDFDNVITLSDLTSYIAQLIIEIRQNNPDMYELKANIQNIMQYMGQLTKESDIDILFNIYKKIQKISIMFRQKLKQWLPSIDIYDHVSYALYFDNQRYVVDELETKWLKVNSDGTLLLQMDQVVQDIDQDVSNIARQKLQNIFNEHYSSYLQAISGMYYASTGYVLGTKRKGNKLNRGHVAEAYESHLASHHTAAYQLLNNTNDTSVLEKMINVLDIKDNPKEYWANHESADEAWVHIRGALGTLRGTAGGDVGRFQVKSGYTSKDNKYSATVRLTSLHNLQDGIERYSDILNNNIPAMTVARQIAMYISEPIAKNEKNLQAYIANKQIRPMLSDQLRHI